MENLEKKIKASIKRAAIKNAVVGTIAGTGIIAAAAVAPGIFKWLKLTNLEKALFSKKKQAIYNAVFRLRKDGLLEESYKEGRRFLAITPKGRKYFQALQNVSKNRPQKWDRRWRVVIFDIEEKYRGIREKVRRELASYGFIKLQNSVWIYPYPCEEYVSLLKSDNRTGKHLLYMVVDEIENASAIKNYFGIKE